MMKKLNDCGSFGKNRRRKLGTKKGRIGVVVSVGVFSSGLIKTGGNSSNPLDKIFKMESILQRLGEIFFLLNSLKLCRTTKKYLIISFLESTSPWTNLDSVKAFYTKDS